MVRRVGAVGLLLLLCVGCTEKPQPRNLVLLTIDTLRADHVGVYGAHDLPTPHMDALARAGLRFERAYTTAPLTAPAHASMLTGRYPSEHGVLYNSMILEAPMVYNAQSTVLSSHLGAQGFRTGAIVTAMPLARRHGFEKGFDTHELVPPPSVDFSTDLGGSSEDALAAARRWLEERGDERFFLWVHLYESHVPYMSPPEIHARLGSTPGRVGMEDVGKKPRSAFQAAYRAEVVQVDDAVGAFMDMLGALDLRKNTVVSLVSDHGEYLGEDELYSHFGVREEVMRIPMMIEGPGVEPAVHTGSASVVDLAPTLLDVLGLPALPGATGRSLARVDRASVVPIFAEWRHIRVHDVGRQAQSRDYLLAVWDGQHKMVRSVLSAEDRAYGLSEGAEHLLTGEEASAVRSGTLSAQLSRFPVAETPVSKAPVEVSTTGVELLKALGYLE